METGVSSTDAIGDIKVHLDLNLISWLLVSASVGVLREKMFLIFSKRCLLLGSYATDLYSNFGLNSEGCLEFINNLLIE